MTTPLHARSDRERRIAVNKLFVQRDSLDIIVNQMDELRCSHDEEDESSCMLVLGDAGVGKSSLLKRYADAHPLIEERGKDGIKRIKPVVYVELVSNTTANGAAEEMLRALMGPGAPRGTGARTSVLPHQLTLWGTKLIIIDEFQHVMETGAKLTRSRTADWIKSITKMNRIPIVMAGMKTIEEIVEDNAQLSSITKYRHVIPAFDPDKIEEALAFRSFLTTMDELLPFKRLSDLDDPDRAARLHLASGGVLRHLHQIIGDASKMAIMDGSARIGDHHLFWACEDLTLHPRCPENPFPEPPDGS